MAVPLFNLAPDLIVSRLCLGLLSLSLSKLLFTVPFSCVSYSMSRFLSGTMTFGEQNSLPESFLLLDKALDSGINFFDSAEMYPVPQRAETQGRSEEYVGRWMRERKVPRDRVMLATKVTGPSGQMTWIRGGPKCLDARSITEAIDSRYVPMFGETEYDPIKQYDSIDIEEQLDGLGRAVDAGKIRYIGLSNETPYGIMKFLHIAGRGPGRPKIVSVQNSYHLLCRAFDCGMAECCHHERVSLLAYSPLAMGILSGKYFLPDGGPSDARLNLFKGRYSEGESRYNLSSPIVQKATKAYLDIAGKYGLHPVSLAVAFVLKHPLVASAVFGATKLWQLDEVLDACKMELDPEIIADIDKVHTTYWNPCP
ncbi:hypothetical protein RHSIM_Rhsim13G0018700 [Rhododendron simsii]|uniref:NADP-dependent oxidoreductase domain-containing protein n=1 Tax=Rhododendron simsii TaxID=118357 RepID=A0A834L5G0_RHOSS|nr:hypothetical protein RHSIM_Rhsim13G0018700 [Rhododendron simsii]